MKKIILIIVLSLLPTLAFADLEAHFLDVGHGDCTIITCDGEAMIIDGGVSSCSQQVFNYLRSLGITDIKFAVASHPDADHIGGLPAAFHAASVKTLLTPIADHDENRFVTLLKTAQEQSATVTVSKAGDVFILGNAKITVLSPAIMFADTNDISLVFRLDYGEKSFLFTGDASSAVERDLIARNAAIDADVLKVSHHGSNTATSAAFVKTVSPDLAIISSGENYDSPSWDVLYNLADTRSLITAQKGTIILQTDGNEISVSYAEQDVMSQQYVGNINSKVFHHSTCASVEATKEKNKVYFDSPEQAKSKGFRPCKNCSP